MDHQLLQQLSESVNRLQGRVRVFQVACVLLLMLFAASLWMGLPPADAQGTRPVSVLRVRGLIIEDAQGRERIVLGAPVPTVAGRKRQDPATALIFLGENGADRVAVGLTPNPQIGGQVAKRVAEAAGIQINDPNGDERGGFGFLDNGRVVLGLDYPAGREAAYAVVDDKEGYAAMMINGEKENTGERAGFYVGRDGTALMKLADLTGLERAILKVSGEADAQLLLVNPKDKSMVDVLEKMKK